MSYVTSHICPCQYCTLTTIVKISQCLHIHTHIYPLLISYDEDEEDGGGSSEGSHVINDHVMVEETPPFSTSRIYNYTVYLSLIAKLPLLSACCCV